MTISSWMSSLDDLSDLLELEVDMLERLLPPPPPPRPPWTTKSTFASGEAERQFLLTRGAAVWSMDCKNG